MEENCYIWLRRSDELVEVQRSLMTVDELRWELHRRQCNVSLLASGCLQIHAMAHKNVNLLFFEFVKTPAEERQGYLTALKVYDENLEEQKKAKEKSAKEPA